MGIGTDRASANIAAQGLKGLVEQKFIIEAQTRMMSVMIVQNFPPLPLFTSEEIDCEEKSFERWHAKFEEPAVMASWENKKNSIS